MLFKISRKNKTKRKQKSLNLKKLTKNNKKVKKSIIKRGGTPGGFEYFVKLMGLLTDDKKQSWCDNPLYLDFKQQLHSSTIIETDPKKCESGMWDKFQAWKALKNGLKLPDDHQWELITANANPISGRQEKHIIWGSIPLKYFFSSERIFDVWENIDNYYTNIRDIIDDSIRLPESLYKKNGITIGETTIHKISGPCSFYFLKPSKNIHLDHLHYFPLIILFGDFHRSKEKSCENCSCSNDNCCYTISDTPFLQLIDTLAEIYPTDFYTETAFLGTNLGFENGYMHDLTTGSFITCYHHVLKNTSINKCPTKNIRWHATDARFMSVSTSYEYDEYAKSLDRNIVSKKFLNDKYIESNFFRLTDIISTLFKKIYDNKLDDIHGAFLNQCFQINDYINKTHFETLDNYLIFIRNILKDTKTKKELYKKFVVEIFKIMNKDNSLIVKQINKQSYPPFKLKEYWQEMCRISLESHHDIHSFIKNNFNDFEINFNLIFTDLLEDFKKMWDFNNELIILERSILNGSKWTDDIRVQFEKIPEQLNLNFLKWSETDLENWIGNHLDPNQKDDAVSYIMHMKISLNQELKDLQNKHLDTLTIDKIEIYKQFFYRLSICCDSFFELYTISRIFKQPEGGKRSDLSICYFGNDHIINIVYMLKNMGLYETSIQLVEDKDITNRCLDFNEFKLNLNDELYDKY